MPSAIQNFIFFILNQKFNFYDYVTDLMHVNTKSNAIHLKIVKSMILETAVVLKERDWRFMSRIFLAIV